MNIFTILIAFILSHISATCSTVAPEPREAQTCADPSLATTYISAFSPTRIAHVIRTPTDMIAADTTNGASDTWQFQGPAFLAWSTPQEFTVPFYQLTNIPSGTDFIFLPEVNGSVPIATGFTVQVPVGYAYSTQICGSVPLLSASNSAKSDHWYTTSQTDHDALIASGSGWVDAGIVFYVLPLPRCTCSA